MRLALWCMLAAFGAQPVPAQQRAPLELSNATVQIRLNPEARGALASVVDRSSGLDFIVAGKADTLFRITVGTGEDKPRELTSADAARWEHSFNRTAAGEELVLRYRNLAGQELHVECRVRLQTGDPLSRWNMSIENRSGWSVQTVVYPLVLAAPQLGPSWADDRVITPVFSSGQLRISQGGANPFPGLWHSEYPGRAQAQFMAYYDATAGLYLATYDGGGHPKKIGGANVKGLLNLSIVHHAWERAGAGWKMPYEFVLGTFQGDWHAAADIYKKWAVQQTWCSRKLTERRDIPSWYLAGLPFVMFIPRAGEYYSTEMPPRTPDRYLTRPPLPEPGLRPRAPEIFAEVGRALRSRLVVVEYGWEKHGAWISPDVFPPYGGDEAYRLQMAALRKNGHIACAYLTGTRWGVEKTGRKDYDGWSAFRRDGLAGAATGPDQEPIIDKSPWASNARLCLGSPMVHKILIDEVRGLVERGVPLVQYDQNIGGETYECHNRNHPHPPGGGFWRTEVSRKFIREARALGRSLDPDFALTTEEPCEFYIQDLDGYNSRPYITTPYSEPAPLFSYLYHEYAAGFGGDSPLGLHLPEADLVRIARTFTAGLLVEGPSFGTSREWPRDELALLAEMVHAQQTYAHDYAILGQMLPAPRLGNVPMLDAALMGTNREIPTTIRATQVAAVTASAWKSPSGRTGYLLVNVLDREARPVLGVRGEGTWIKLSSQGRTRLTARNGELEAPLGPGEVALVEQEGGVK
jgi:hypothetical protein